MYATPSVFIVRRAEQVGLHRRSRYRSSHRQQRWSPFVLCRPRHERVYPRRQWYRHRRRGAERESAVTGLRAPRRMLGSHLGLCRRRGLCWLAVMLWVRLLLRSACVCVWQCCIVLWVLWLVVKHARHCRVSCRLLRLRLLFLQLSLQ